jgi:hypothetical protein
MVLVYKSISFLWYFLTQISGQLTDPRSSRILARYIVQEENSKRQSTFSILRGWLQRRYSCFYFMSTLFLNKVDFQYFYIIVMNWNKTHCTSSVHTVPLIDVLLLSVRVDDDSPDGAISPIWAVSPLNSGYRSRRGFSGIPPVKCGGVRVWRYICSVFHVFVNRLIF